MSGYTKLFNSILASTIWRADDKTRLVWITLLAMADRQGNVEASIPGLADFARVSLPDCLKALTELEAPDEFSRSKEFDGRRIEPIDGGWRLVNHGKYRHKLSQDERREYLKLKQREHRKRQQPSTNVNNVSDISTLSTQAEATPEATPDTKAKEQVHVSNTHTPKRPNGKMPEALDGAWEQFKAAYPSKRRENGYMAQQWFIIACEKVGIAALLAAVTLQKQSEDWKKGMVPGLEKWLEKELWIQEPETPESGHAGMMKHLEELERRKTERRS